MLLANLLQLLISFFHINYLLKIIFICIKIYEFFNIVCKSGEQSKWLFTGPRLTRSPVNDTLSTFATKSS